MQWAGRESDINQSNFNLTSSNVTETHEHCMLGIKSQVTIKLQEVTINLQQVTINLHEFTRIYNNLQEFVFIIIQ